MIGLSRTAAGFGSEIVLVLVSEDRTNPDPAKNLRCYKRGDVQDVLPAAAHDGDLAANPVEPPWWLLRVVGIPRAVAAKYLAPVTDGEAMTRRRLYGVVYASLPPTVQMLLTSRRYAVVQWNTLRLAMRNKVTLQTEP